MAKKEKDGKPGGAPTRASKIKSLKSELARIRSGKAESVLIEKIVDAERAESLKSLSRDARKIVRAALADGDTERVEEMLRVVGVSAGVRDRILAQPVIETVSPAAPDWGLRLVEVMVVEAGDNQVRRENVRVLLRNAGLDEERVRELVPAVQRKPFPAIEPAEVESVTHGAGALAGGGSDDPDPWDNTPWPTS